MTTPSSETMSVPPEEEAARTGDPSSSLRSGGGQPPEHRLEHVELVLPVRPELWILARMSASAIASKLEFGIDAIEDLKLAIDELCTSCAVGATTESRLRLDYRFDEDSVRVHCAVAPVVDTADEEALETVALSSRILGAFVDEYAIEEVKEGRRRGWLTKRRRTQPS